jgi:pimeloyl-ACP methyl ester carboxylesterase
MRQESFLSLGRGGFHRVAYTDWGDPENPHVVVCVHGLSRNSRDFDFLAEALARDCRVVCMDVVGRGDSDWLEEKSEYNFATYLRDAATLLARITQPPRSRLFPELHAIWRRSGALRRVDWVGTSMGGLIGMMLAAKGGSPIGSLIMNDVGPFVPWNALYRLKGHVGHRHGFGSLERAESFLREAFASFGIRDERHWSHLVRHSVRLRDDGRYVLRYDPAIGTTLPGHPDPELPLGPQAFRGVDLWTVWNAVRCPVLVLRGALSDVLSAETVAEMKRRKPGTRSLELARVGHAPALFEHDQIAAVCEFLRRPVARKPTAEANP